MCLICGHVGCGRYRKGHAAEHSRSHNHAYSLELEAQRVWDYTNDNYVHRLVQSKKNGKLMELPSPAPSSSQAQILCVVFHLLLFASPFRHGQLNMLRLMCLHLMWCHEKADIL